MQGEHITKFQFEELGTIANDKPTSHQTNSEPHIQTDATQHSEKATPEKNTPSPEEKAKLKEEVKQRNQEAEQLLKDAEQKIKEAESKGFQEGYEKGLAEGTSATQAVDEQVAHVLENIAAQLAPIHQKQADTLQALEDDTIILAQMIAQKIAVDAIKANSTEVITSIVKQTLPLLSPKTDVTIYVNPNLMDAVNEKVTKIADDANVNLLLKADEGLARPDCKIEWDGGEITRSIDDIWQQVEALCAVEGKENKEPAVEEPNEPEPPTEDNASDETKQF